MKKTHKIKLNNDVTYKVLDWDSNLFGYKVAQVKIKKLESRTLQLLSKLLKENKIHLAYLFLDYVNHKQLELIRRFKGIYADKKVSYRINTNLELSYSFDSILRLDKLQSPSRLISLALQSGEYSRFKTDKGFKENEFIKLYTLWLKKSMNGGIDKCFFIYKEGNVIKGFVTLLQKDKKIWIDLLAVDNKFRGKSIGTNLIRKCISESKRLGYNYLWVATQAANVIACKFYKKNGFRIVRTKHVFHFWN